MVGPTGAASGVGLQASGEITRAPRDSACGLRPEVRSPNSGARYNPKVSERPLAIGPRVLDIGELVALAAGDEPGAHGAVVTFVGTVRGLNQGRKVIRLEYEAYEPLALRAFAIIRDEVAVHWPSARVAFHHRTGPIALGEASVAIAAASPRRADAFAACRYVIERLKQIAPVWKHEYFEDGDVWIEGAVADPSDEKAKEEAFRRSCA